MNAPKVSFRLVLSLTAILGLVVVANGYDATTDATKYIIKTTKESFVNTTHYVVVMLEAKPEKEAILKQELLNVQTASLQESACLGYTVLEDINNHARFVLYEMWTSKEQHAQQFQKPYIIAFGNKLNDLVVMPYHYLMGQESFNQAP